MAKKKEASTQGKETAKSKAEAKALSNKSNDKKTTIVGGRGKMNPDTGIKFTKDNQPSGAAKSAGKKRAKTLREFLSMPLKKGKLPKDFQAFLTECVQVYGINKEDVDVRLFMEMRMASRAVRGDVAAYKALLDRAIGKPREEQAPIIDTVETRETNRIRLPDGTELEI